MLSFLFILAVEQGDKMYAKESRSKIVAAYEPERKNP